MDLAELKFVINTEDLERAAKEVANLGTEVSRLNKPMQEFTKESAKTSKELSKAEEAAAKAALAQTRLEQAQSRSLQSTGKSNTVLERQNLILEYMAQGNSKGQASILATAKAAGALDDEMLKLNETLKTQRTLIGGDPFDKSIGLMQKLQNEEKTTIGVNELFNRSLGLTEKQMIDLAREKQRLIALYEHEGKSLDGLAAEYEQIVQMSRQINQANDARTNSMNAQIKAQSDSAKASEYIAKELERVNRLTESNGNLTSATNNKIIKFEQALKLSGQTAAQQATALDKYKTSLLSVQKAGGDRQVDYLSRALGPQITDIFVGLATGQSPMMVLLQQGGQLRDQFALAGVAGKNMGDMLVKAAGTMVTSVKDVGIAVGQVLVTAIIGAGKSITDFAMNITGTNAILDAFRTNLVSIKGESSLFVKSFDVLAKGIVAFSGVIAFTAIAALVAFGVAMSDVIKEENALNRALNLTGAAMGVSLDAAYGAAKAMEEFGVSTGTALEVLTEMAKIGGMSADSLEMVSTTAKALKTAFDIPIADTVKKFKELQEKPTESLTKLAKDLGTIPIEILKQVQAYEKAGDSIKAAELATKTYADAGKDAADRTVQNFGTITTLGITLAKIWDKTWQSIMGIGRADTNDEKITDLSKRLATLLAAQDPRQVASRKPMVDATIAEIQAIALQINKEKELEDQRQKNATAATKFEADNKKKAEKAKKDTKELTDIEKERAEFLKVMSDLEDKASGFTKQYSDQLNVLNIGLTEGWLTQDEFNMKLQELNKVQPSVIKAHKDRADAIEKEIQAQKKADDALGESWSVMEQLNKQILDQTDLLVLEGSLIGATDAERKKALGAKRLDLQLEKEIADIRKRNIPQSEKDDQENQARQRRLAAEKNLNKEIANDFAAEMQKQYDVISNGLTDATITGLFEGGKAGSKKLRDLVVAELKKPITIVVKAIVDATVGSFMSGMMGGTGGSTVGSALGSTVGSAVSGFQLGSSTLGEVFSAFGKGLMSGGAPEALGTAGFATEAGSTAASAYGAGASASELAITAGPYVLAAVAALNALGVFRSTKTVGGGITGTLGAGNLEAYNLTRTSGTLFNGPSYGANSQGATEATIALDKAFIAMREAITGTVDSLGFSTDSIKNFTMAVGDIKIHPDIAQLGLVLDGLSDEQKVAKINEVLTKSGNAMAELILGTGTTLEKLKSTFDFFYQNFYSESEKFDNLTKDLTASFAKLGLSLPSTRDQFKQLVIAAQKAGDTALLKALTDLQYAFAELVPAASTASKSIVASAEAINEAYKNLKSSAMTAEDIAKQRIDLERKLFEATATNSQLEADRRNAIDNSNLALYEQIKAAENVKTSSESLSNAQGNVLKAEKELTKARADSLSSFISATKGYVDSLRKYSQSLLLGAQSTLTPEQKYTTSKAQLDSLIKIATGTANTPEEIAARDKAASSIEGAATAFLEASRTYNASSSQYTEDFKFVQQAISLTASALEAQVTDAQKQLGALGDIDVGISAVETAVNNLAAAQREVAIAQQAFNAAVLAGDVSGLNTSASSAAASVLGSAVVSNGIVYGAQGGLTSSSASQFKTDVQSWMNQTASKDYFTANPDVAAMYAQNSYGMTKDAFAQSHYKTYGMAEGRVSPDVEAKMVKDLYAKIVGEWGLDSATLAQVMGTSQQSILDYFTPYGLPAFAKGTNYVPDDMYAKIHQGERIIPAADNTRLFQSLSDRNETNAVLVTEIRNLRQEIVDLREQQSQETATIVVSNLDAQQRSADSINSTISNTSQESNWNSKVRESVKLK